VSELEKFYIGYEYGESYPQILKMIRRARSAKRKRKQAQEAKISERKLSSTKQLHAKGTRRNNRDKSTAKKAKD